MAGYFERWRRRQRELREGVDADLLQTNRRRFRLALSLVGIGLVLVAVAGKLRLSSRLDAALRVTAAVSVMLGIVLLQWARRERLFLEQPDSEGPPKIFRDPHNPD